MPRGKIQVTDLSYTCSFYVTPSGASPVAQTVKKVKVKVAQSCPALRPQAMGDGYTVAIPFSSRLPDPRMEPGSSALQSFFTVWASLIAQLVKNPPRFLGSIPGSGRSAEEGTGYPRQYSWASLVAQLVKNRPQLEKPGFDPWVEKIPWRREGLPPPVF